MPDTIAYVRVSTEDQAAERKSSLTDQRTAIAALAAQLERMLPADAVFADPGVSGGSAERRPGFMAMVHFCEQHPRPRRTPGQVLVLNESRWGRFPDPEEAAYWRIRLEKLGWHVRFVEDDTQDVGVRAILRSVHATQARAYREAIRANSRRGARAAAAKGLWQNEAPIGYRRSASVPGRPGRILEPYERKGDHEETRLVPGPMLEREIVRYAFARYAEGGVSLGVLVRDLAQRWPVKRWSRGTLGAMLKNPVYMGDVIWCRRVRDDVEHRQRPQSRDEWVTTADAHEPLVDRALFARVQERLGQNRRQTRATAGGYPLSGLIRCLQCGGTYTGGGGPRGPAGDPDRYRFYRDSGADGYNGRPPVCPGHVGTLQKRWIEPVIVREVAAIVARPEHRAAISAELDRQLKARQARDPAARRTELVQERRRLEEERDRLLGAISRGTVADAEAAGHLGRIRAQLEAASAAEERLRFGDRREETVDAERERLVALAGDFAAVAARASGAQLRELLRPWLADAVMDKVKRKLTLTIRLLPSPGAFLDSSHQGGLNSQDQKPEPAIRRVITLPPRRIQRRRVA